MMAEGDTVQVDADYYGLYCEVCGSESGNTDLCVPCAIRIQRLDEVET